MLLPKTKRMFLLIIMLFSGLIIGSKITAIIYLFLDYKQNPHLPNFEEIKKIITLIIYH
jgi:hypothetical protein